MAGVVNAPFRPRWWCGCSAYAEDSQTGLFRSFPEVAEGAARHFQWHREHVGDTPVVAVQREAGKNLYLYDPEQAARILAQVAEMKRVPTGRERFDLAQQTVVKQLYDAVKLRGLDKYTFWDAFTP